MSATLGRELAPGSDWCQRWTPGGGHSWRHTSEGGFDRRRYGVAAIAEAPAKAFVVGHHYSGTFPAAVLRFGLHEFTSDGPRLVGVMVLSVPASKRVLTNVFPGLDAYSQSLELGRFVLTDEVPGNGETFFLAEGFRLAAREGVRGVVSFADPMPRATLDGRTVFPGHRGAIYQAKSGLYLGRGTARSLTLLPDGSVISARAQQKIRRDETGHEYAERVLIGHGASARWPGEDGRVYLRRALVAVGARKVSHPGNHRYGFLLGPRATRRVQVAIPSLPYPKGEAAAGQHTRGERHSRAA